MSHEFIDNNKQKPPTFFNKLSKFCSELDSETLHIKKNYEKPPGTYPMQYCMAMKTLKTEVDDLKKLADEAKDKMSKVYQFDYFVQSVKELLKEQADDVKGMEEYLERFGYIIPDKDMFTAKTESLTDKSSDLRKNNATEPEANQIVVEKDSQHLVIADKTSPKCDTVKGMPELTTPLQRKKQPAWYSTPGTSALKRVEHWLENVEAEASSSFLATPIVTNQCKEGDAEKTSQDSPHKEEGEHILNNYDLPKLRMDVELDDKTYSTPEEPPMSSVTKHLLSTAGPLPSNTPEEPTLSVLGSSVVSRMDDGKVEQSHTPDEPQLSLHGKTIAEASDGHSQKTHTPEEPLIQAQHPLPCRYKINAPAIGGQRWRTKNVGGLVPKDARGQEPPHEIGSRLRSIASFSQDEPTSPQLSDITQKILNLKSTRSSDSDSTKEQVDYTPKQDYKDHAPNRYLSARHLSSTEPQSPQLSDLTMQILGLK